MHAYGHTGHAFTDASVAPGGRAGFGYQPDSDRRSWAAMVEFLGRVLS